MNTQSIDDFLTQAFENGGDLSPEQAAQLLQMGDTPGDTGAAAPEPSNVPDVAPAQIEGHAVPEGEKTATPDESGLTAENAVILAKDGKHTISYDKLVQAREAAQTAQAAQQAMAAQLEAANQKLVELQAQAQARAEAGQAPTQADTNAAAAQAAIDAGVDPALFGDFSPEAMAKGVAQLVQAQLDARMAAIDAKLQPIQQQTARSATEVHLSAIYSAHPDADSIVESQEFAAWKSAQPGVVRAALDAALTTGSTNDVIEVFSAFKAATGQAAVPTAATAKAGQISPAQAAKAAIARAAAPMPASISDIPGGRAGPTNVLEAMENMNGPEMLSAMNAMTPEQIDAYLNAQI
ncbi:MAG TPA: hypothetical protein PLE35_05145 [Lentisphaeria bacterium]|nr:hypothetical protein [Lentisphaeria bacterium]